MATIATTTSGIAIDYPSHATFARDPSTGYYYFFARSDNTTGYRVWRSIDGGTTWTTYASFTRSGIGEWSSIVIDKARKLHIAYRFSDGTYDRLFYRLLDLTTATWSAELQVSGTNGSGDANGGVAGAFWQGCDIAVVRNNNGSYAIAVAASVTYSGSKYGVIVHGVSIGVSGTIYLNNGIISGNRSFQTSGTPTGGTRPAMELEHNGDGITSSTPNLWITWGRSRLYMVKLSWAGSANGWNGPSAFQTIDSSIPGVDYVPGRWDGLRWMMAVIDTDDNSVVDVYERNQANSQTTVRYTPQHPNGVVRTLAMTYDSNTKNPRVYAVGTTNATLYYVDFVRATGLWGTWTQLSTDAITATPPDEFTTRRGGTTGDSRYSIAYTTGTVSPYTLKSIHQALQVAPTTPTWDTSTVPYTNGGAADVNAALVLDWTFNDVDPTDTQSAYALRRQIGAGAFAWWRASDSTWQAVETFNTSGTTSLTLASAWAAGTDANYTFNVKTRDSGALDSPYSAAMVLVPSVKANPTISTPTAAQVLTTNYVSVSWTVSEQKQYRVQLATNPGGVQVYDSGYRNDSAATSFVPPYDLPDNSGWTVSLTTTNLEGLASTVQTRNFTVDFIEPATPTLVATPSTANGWIALAVTNPAPTGGQPAVSYQDLYRRKVGDTDNGTRIATALASGGTFNDNRAAARTAYEYRVITYGVNGAFIASSWTP
jgi:hypothetical protein